MDTKFGCPRIGKEMEKLAIIKNGAVAIKEGKIIHVGSTEDVIKKVTIGKDTIEVDATNKLVTPGLVDPHVHLIFAGTRENELSMSMITNRIPRNLRSLFNPFLVHLDYSSMMELE